MLSGVARHQLHTLLAQHIDHVRSIEGCRFGILFHRTTTIHLHLDETGIAAGQRYGLDITAQSTPGRSCGTEGRRNRSRTVHLSSHKTFAGRFIYLHRAFIRIFHRIHLCRIGLFGKTDLTAGNRVNVLIGQRSHHAEELLRITGIRPFADALLLDLDGHLQCSAGQGIGNGTVTGHHEALTGFHLSLDTGRGNGHQAQRDQNFFHMIKHLIGLRKNT